MKVRAAGTPRMIFSSAGSMCDAAGTGKLAEDAPVCVRDYIHVADLAAAHLLALEAIDRPRQAPS